MSSNGDVHSCCQTDFSYSLGSVKNNSLAEIWNKSEYKKLRLDMLADKKMDACRSCYQREEAGMSSLRIEANDEWEKIYDVSEITAEDGSLNTFEPKYIDLRFSNICNFKCRSCGPAFSTSWYIDSVKLGNDYRPDYDVGSDHEKIWDELRAILPFVKQIYFAGGEPLLLKDHYKLLDELIRLNLTDVKLIYNTNLSTLKLGKRNILSYWQKFKYVKVSASLDGIEKKGEYIRSGMNWNDFFNNHKKIELFTPHVCFSIFWTLSVLNAFHLTEAMTFFSEKKMLKSALNFEINLLSTPEMFNIKIFNDVERSLLKSHYDNFLNNEFLTLEIKDKENYKNILNNIMSFLQAGYFEEERITFWKFNNDLDKVRNESLLNLFPELSSLV